MSLADLNAKISGVKSSLLAEAPDGVGNADVVKPITTSKNGPESSRARVAGPPALRETSVYASPVIKSLVDAITTDDVTLILKAWRRALKAKRRIWDMAKKKWIFEHDIRAQLEATKIMAAYKEGLPVARQVSLTFGHEELKDVIAAAKQSPVMMTLLQRAGLTNFSDVQKTGGEKIVELPSEKSGAE